MPDDDKKTTLDLIESLRELRADMALRRTQLHTANNEMFKTVGELSLEQIRLRKTQEEINERMTALDTRINEGMTALETKIETGINAIVEQARFNGSKAAAAVVVTERTSDKASRAILENRIGVAVLGIVGLIIQYLTNHH